MNKTIKILLSIFILIVVLISSTLFFISTKINPELIRKTAIEAIEKNIPGAKVQIGSIDYSIGSSVTLNVANVLLTEKKNKLKLLELGSLSVKVPVLSILTSGGTIDILTDAPKVYVRKHKHQINWIKVLGTKKGKIAKVTKSEKKVETKSLALPSFINKSKINFKLNDLSLLLDLGKNQKSDIKVSTIQVKDLSLTNSTAFEVASSIKFQLDENKFFQTEVQIIGEARLGDIIEKGDLNLSTKINVAKTKIDGVELVIPNLKGKTKISGNLDNINVELDINLNQILNLQSNINIKNDIVNAKDILIEIIPSEAINMFSPSITHSLKQIDFTDVKLKLLGSSTFNLKTQKINPNLKISTVKSIGVNTFKGLTIGTKIEGHIKGEQISLKVNNDVMGGVVVAEVKTSLNPMKIPADISKLKPISVKVLLNNLKVPKEFLQDFLWSEKKEKLVKVDQDTEVRLVKKGVQVLLPKVNIELIGERIKIADQEISLKGSINVDKKDIRSKGIILKFGQGKISTSFHTVIQNTKKIQNFFRIDLVKVDVSAFNAFFPPFINDIKGNYNGVVNGSLNLQQKMTYKINASLVGIKGEIQKLDLKKMLKPLIDKYAKGKADSLKDFSNKFDRLTVKALATDQKVVLNLFEMIGYKKSSMISASGHISMIDKKSKIRGKLSSKSLIETLKKSTGLTKIPYLLKGQGFVLLPDIGYTAGKLASAAVKVTVKKETKKLEIKIKNAAEKKIKNLLKGFKL
jgi:hypothetical protein